MNHDETHAQAHEKAIAAMTAEGYLLGELSDAEAEAFEQHYFDCRVCSDTIRAGTAMFAAGREVVKSENVRPVITPPGPATGQRVLTFRRRFQQSMSLAAAAALTVVVGYQGFVIPWIQKQGARPIVEVLTPTPLVTDAVRGPNEEQFISFPGDTPVVLYRDIPPEPPFPLYQLEFRAAGGKVIGVGHVSEEQARSGDSIPLSVRPLPAGRYVLAIVGVRKDGSRSELDQWSLVVQ